MNEPLPGRLVGKVSHLIQETDRGLVHTAGTPWAEGDSTRGTALLPLYYPRDAVLARAKTAIIESPRLRPSALTAGRDRAITLFRAWIIVPRAGRRDFHDRQQPNTTGCGGAWRRGAAGGLGPRAGAAVAAGSGPGAAARPGPRPSTRAAACSGCARTGPSPLAAASAARSTALFRRRRPAAPSAPPDSGPFFDVELDFLKPHLKNQLDRHGHVPRRIDGHVPDARRVAALDRGAALRGRLQLRRRLRQPVGRLPLPRLRRQRDRDRRPTGRSTSAAGCPSNQFDFDYTSGRYSPGPFWDLKWPHRRPPGRRLSSTPAPTTASPAEGQQQLPRRRPALRRGRRAAHRPGARPGPVRPRRRRRPGRRDPAAVPARDWTATTFFGDDERRRTQSVPTLTLQAGLSYTPPRMDFLHFTAGYQFEQWWNIGRLGRLARRADRPGVLPARRVGLLIWCISSPLPEVVFAAHPNPSAKRR